VTGTSGTPVYVDNYVDGYQVYAGEYVVLPNGSDLSFAPPVYLSEDDGLVFPLTNSQVVLHAGVLGDLSAQTRAVHGVLQTMADVNTATASHRRSGSRYATEAGRGDALGTLDTEGHSGQPRMV
jgi:hypothetical protein